MTATNSIALNYSDTQTVLDASTIPEDPSAIKMLSLVNNGISDLPQEVSLFSELTILRVLDNPLARFPAISPLASLELLYIVRCGLTEVPDSIADLPRLSLANFSHNSIATVSPQLFRLPGIVHIILDHNRVTSLTIPGEVDVGQMHLGLVNNPVMEEDESLEVLGKDGLVELFGDKVKFSESESTSNKGFKYEDLKFPMSARRPYTLTVLALVVLVVCAVGTVGLLNVLLRNSKK